MTRYLAACAIFKNEAPYLDEWIRFHIGVGIEHLYLYNNNSTDEFQPVLAPWIGAGRVTFCDWPTPESQLAAYVHCLNRHKRENRWVAFIDLDELLFSPEAATLPEILADFEAFPGLGANWVMFGSSGHVARPGGLVTRSYLRRADFQALRIMHRAFLRPGGDPRRLAGYRPYCCMVKGIVDPSLVVRVRTAHSFRFVGNAPMVDENAQPIRGPLGDKASDRVSVRRIRLNHYWSRSLTDLQEKLQRGQAIRKPDYDPAWAFRFEKQLNAIDDRTILPQVDRIFGIEAKESAS